MLSLNFIRIFFRTHFFIHLFLGSVLLFSGLACNSSGESIDTDIIDGGTSDNPNNPGAGSNDTTTSQQTSLYKDPLSQSELIQLTEEIVNNTYNDFDEETKNQFDQLNLLVESSNSTSENLVSLNLKTQISSPEDEGLNPLPIESLYDAYMLCGTQAIFRGNYQVALVCFFHAFLESPQDPISSNNLGFTLNTLGEFEKAEEVLNYAQDLDPDLPVINENLAAAQVGIIQNLPDREDRNISYALECARLVGYALRALDNNPLNPRLVEDLVYELYECELFNEAGNVQVTYRGISAFMNEYEDDFTSRDFGYSIYRQLFLDLECITNPLDEFCGWERYQTTSEIYQALQTLNDSTPDVIDIETDIIAEEAIALGNRFATASDDCRTMRDNESEALSILHSLDDDEKCTYFPTVFNLYQTNDEYYLDNLIEFEEIQSSMFEALADYYSSTYDGLMGPFFETYGSDLVNTNSTILADIALGFEFDYLAQVWSLIGEHGQPGCLTRESLERRYEQLSGICGFSNNEFDSGFEVSPFINICEIGYCVAFEFDLDGVNELSLVIGEGLLVGGSIKDDFTKLGFQIGYGFITPAGESGVFIELVSDGSVNLVQEMSRGVFGVEQTYPLFKFFPEE